MKDFRQKRAEWPKKVPPLTPEQMEAREKFMKRWHQVLPRKYKIVEQFNHGFAARQNIVPGSRSLEIGAGLGAHAAFEDLTKQDYHCLEYREEFCLELRKRFPADHVHCGDIQKRQDCWPDASFDRIIAIHVLEHLLDLPSALAEIQRLLKPEGAFDVVLPTEGGLAYSLARKLSAERLFHREFKMSYQPIVANEHVSTFKEIHEILLEDFTTEVRRFFPLIVPMATFNLCVGLRLRKK